MERTAKELRAYQKRRHRGKGDEPIPEFDSFLEEVNELLKLRTAAEENFRNNPHLAKNKKKALPLDWSQIKATLAPDKKSPPISLLTRIAHECVNETEQIIRDLRKVLIREREKVSIGLAQQIDAHCLRWFTRQPGRDALEKAGTKQRILAVVRKENFNTLENRVFKDFLERVNEGARHYLRRHEKKFPESPVIKEVRRIFKLAQEGLDASVMETVTDVNELPMPNYVLRQERRYSKIWKHYCLLVREAEIAERLWGRRDDVRRLLKKIKSEIPRHTDIHAKYHCPLWFNYVDGKQEFLDKPFFTNELCAAKNIKTLNQGLDSAPEKWISSGKTQQQWEKLTSEPFNVTFEKIAIRIGVRDEYLNCLKRREAAASVSDELRVIDLTGRQPCRDLLIYGSHENAKPHLQNYEKPSIEDLENTNAKHHFLRDILNDDSAGFNIEILRDYFEQLYAIIRGERWIVLVPDDWRPERQEEILRAVPLSRDKVTLLWRGVAAVLGAKEQLSSAKRNENVGIVDLQQNGKVNFSVLTLIEGDDKKALVPQRKSYERAKNERYLARRLQNPSGTVPREDALLGGKHIGDTRSIEDVSSIFDVSRPSLFRSATHTVFIGKFSKSGRENFHARTANRQIVVFEDNASLLECGARVFDKKRSEGKIAYYDELEGLSLIIQTRDEQVAAKELVVADERFPGGQQTLPITNDDTSVRNGQEKISFFLCMGIVAPNAPLKELETPLASIPEQDEKLHIETRMTPGQGMAIAEISAPFLAHPIVLDFLKMTPSKETMESIEENMERSFPPDSPDVVCDLGLWDKVKDKVDQYMNGERPPYGKWFACALNIYSPRGQLPSGASPLERLRRKNVFGNEKERRLPCADFDFDALFERLANDYTTAVPYVRLEIIQLVAWTYQWDNPIFEHMKRDSLQKVLNFAAGRTPNGPRPQEYTLLANLCSTPKEWELCLKAISLRLQYFDDKASEYLRLLYNLLQFHPTIIFDTEFYKDDKCWSIMKFLPKWYERGKDNSTQIGFVLKSMLYLLRCRRFDGKRFLTQENDAEHYQIIADCLSISVWKTKEPLRELVLKYLNGKGTIDGLPTD